MAEMTAQEAAEWGKTLDFPTVWATLTKMGERVDKMAIKVDQTTENLKGLSDEVRCVTINVNNLTEKVDRVTANVKGLSDEVRCVTTNVNNLTEKVNRVTTNVGGLNHSMGSLIETLFAPHLGEKFDAYNYNLKRIFNRVPIYDDNSRLRSDIDILLSNTTVCMAVEVKRWLEKKEHVDEHIKRMQLIRQYPPAEVKGKKLLGAIVGAVVTPEAREYAEQNGLFVLELTGEDVRLFEPPKDFQPKEW
jgi:hypothetical protein